MSLWSKKVENDFIRNINDTYTLNLAISILEDRELFIEEIERLNNIIKEVREWKERLNNKQIIDLNWELEYLDEILDKEGNVDE